LDDVSARAQIKSGFEQIDGRRKNQMGIRQIQLARRYPDIGGMNSSTTMVVAPDYHVRELTVVSVKILI
jgi:hypothetical protein